MISHITEKKTTKLDAFINNYNFTNTNPSDFEKKPKYFTKHTQQR